MGKVPNSPEYNYWLARYAIMAGDYATAKTIAQPFPNAAGLTANLVRNHSLSACSPVSLRFASGEFL